MRRPLDDHDRARASIWYLALTAAAALTHFWRLGEPRAVSFDEVYYLRFAGDYLTHRFLFDVHPPLGRLLFAAQAALMHIPAADLLRPLPEPALRVLPALAGTLLVPLLFLVMRQLGAPLRTAGIAATAVLLDNALLAFSRIAVPDAFILVFGLGSISVYLAARDRIGWKRLCLITLSATLCGCALSVKWTGASALGLVGVLWALEMWRTRDRRRTVREGAILVVMPAMVYLVSFAIHFALLTHSGPGDTVMSPRFQSTLVGSLQYNAAAPKLSFWETLAETHHAIRYGNGELERVTNPGSSPWYTWPVMKHPIGLGGSLTPVNGVRRVTILLGNPVVWWGSLALAIALLGVMVARRQPLLLGEQIFLAGFLFNFLPFIAITRLMYLYHYLFALVFLIGLGAFALERFVPPARARPIYTGVAALMLAGFLYFLPFTYGWPLSDASWEMHFRVLHPF